MWFKALLMRLFRVPIRYEVFALNLKGKRLEQFTPDHYRAWGNLFADVPGLEEAWLRALDQAVRNMEKELSGKKDHLELVRLCQRTVDVWQNLNIPAQAAAELRQFIQNATPEPKKAEIGGSKNLIE